MKLSLVIYFLALILLSSSVFVQIASAQEIQSVLISEVMPGSSDSASAEFIEVKNTTSNWINLTDWKLEYKSATGENWIKKADINFNLGPQDYILIATEITGLTPDILISSGLAQTGGHIRLIDADQIEVDKMGWGNAIDPEANAANNPQINQSLKRIVDEDGNVQDVNDNFLDFFQSDNPSPTKSKLIQDVCIVEEDEPEPELPEIIDINKNYAQLQITELFIDPASPLLDKEDEFIELHNPNPFPVSIKDYVLKSGNDFQYEYKLPEYELEPEEYLAIFSIDSALVLSNSGGRAGLFDPTLVMISATDIYEKAKTNFSWSKIANTWLWSNLPTPHSANRVQEEDKADEQVLAKRTITILATDDSVDKNSQPSKSDLEVSSSTPSNKISTSTLVSFAVVALLYAMYEYRNEIVRIFKKLGGNVMSWRENRQKTSRKRNHRVGR